eukprot:1604473-Amphidinium_carterae.2
MSERVAEALPPQTKLVRLEGLAPTSCCGQVVWKGPDFREEILSSFPAAFSAHVGGDSVMVCCA